MRLATVVVVIVVVIGHGGASLWLVGHFGRETRVERTVSESGARVGVEKGLSRLVGNNEEHTITQKRTHSHT